MKKGVFWICLLLSVPVLAGPKPDVDLARLEQIILQDNQPLTDEQIIESVLQTPFEYRQYTVPQLHESVYTSQKVRTHPDIIIWKGKVPTRIAPQLQEWAKEHLAYLPASFYPAVMPEMWPNPNQEQRPTPDIAQRLQGISDNLSPNPNSVLNKLDGPRVQILGAPLTEEDVTRLPGTIQALEDFYAAQPDQITFRSQLLSSADPQLPMIMRLAYPFHSLMARLTKMGYGKEVNQLLRAQGWSDAKDFANKADRLLKAYRANFLRPLAAIELYKIRQKYSPTSPNRTDRSQWMYASLYESSPEDIAFAAPYLKQLRRTFLRKDMLVAGTMVYLD